MARDVNEILINICKNQGQMSQSQAVQYVKDLAQKSRYAQDVWSWKNWKHFFSLSLSPPKICC